MIMKQRGGASFAEELQSVAFGHEFVGSHFAPDVRRFGRQDGKEFIRDHVKQTIGLHDRPLMRKPSEKQLPHRRDFHARDDEFAAVPAEEERFHLPEIATNDDVFPSLGAVVVAIRSSSCSSSKIIIVVLTVSSIGAGTRVSLQLRHFLML